MRRYQPHIEAPTEGPAMPATVVAFPYRHASAHHREPPPDPACTQVIRFPSLPARLTERDLDALVALAASARSAWRCEAERDCNGDLSAIFVSGEPEGDDRATFLICRGGRKLLLIDAQRAADWRMLGVFDEMAELTLALARIIE
jgi:hypothetical protein